MKRLNPTKTGVRKILRTLKKFNYTKLPPKNIKNLLPEKRKETVQTKQPRFKSRLKQDI